MQIDSDLEVIDTSVDDSVVDSGSTNDECNISLGQIPAKNIDTTPTKEHRFNEVSYFIHRACVILLFCFLF